MFLRHLRRTRVILHVVDAAAPDPAADYWAVREELRMYNPEYTARPHVVALNKMDLDDAAELREEVTSEVLSGRFAHCLDRTVQTSYRLCTPVSPLMKSSPKGGSESDPALSVQNQSIARFASQLTARKRHGAHQDNVAKCGCHVETGRKHMLMWTWGRILPDAGYVCKRNMSSCRGQQAALLLTYALRVSCRYSEWPQSFRPTTATACLCLPQWYASAPKRVWACKASALRWSLCWLTTVRPA